MIGTRLRRIRTSRGMTQAQLAMPSYTHAYVSAIESGRRSPSAKALAHFAKQLDVDVEELTIGRSRDAETRLRLRLQEAVINMSAGKADEAERTFRSVAKQAQTLELPVLRAKAEEARGLSLERHERIEEALGRYNLAEEILSDEPPTSRVDAVAGKARCFHSLGDIRYEIHLLETLLSEIQRKDLQDPDALARVHSGLVYAYLEAGLLGKAAESALELELIEPRLSDPLRVAQMHLHVARLYLQQGKAEQAKRSLFRAEDAYLHLSLKTEAAYTDLALGYLYSRQGELDMAAERLARARATFEQTNDTKDLTRTMNELARVERLRGRSDEARALLRGSIALMKETDTPILAWAYRELGRVMFDEPEDAEKSLRMAIELYERSEQFVELAVTYGVLGDLLAKRGGTQAACDVYRTGITSLERAG